MAALTRGSLPPSVYWRRRLILLTLVLVLLWALLHLVTGGGGTPKQTAHLTDASSTASPKAAASPSTSPVSSPTSDLSASPTAPPPVASETPTPTTPPSPTGDCAPSDMSVTPSVTGAAAGSDVAIVLNLSTFTTPACTWHVSSRTMQVKVSTARGGDIWSTVECPSAITSSDVVVYKDTPTPVAVTWNGRKSDSTCSTHTDWVNKGTYSVTGVALGGTPDQASFVLGPPVPSAPAAPTTQPGQPTTTPNGAPSSSAPAASGSPSSSAPATPKKKHHKKKVIAD